MRFGANSSIPFRRKAFAARLFRNIHMLVVFGVRATIIWIVRRRAFACKFEALTHVNSHTESFVRTVWYRSAAIVPSYRDLRIFFWARVTEVDGDAHLAWAWIVVDDGSLGALYCCAWRLIPNRAIVLASKKSHRKKACGKSPNISARIVHVTPLPPNRVWRVGGASVHTFSARFLLSLTPSRAAPPFAVFEGWELRTAETGSFCRAISVPRLRSTVVSSASTVTSAVLTIRFL